MSECKQAQSHEQQIAELKDSRLPKTERERAAVHEIERLEQRLYVARDLLQQIHDCPVNWVESTIPKGGMDPDNPRHRGQVVGTQHIAYTRLYNIASFLRKNIEHMLNTELSKVE